ncbi:peptidylprolyl isomerase [Turneriella parva]|uniref:Peptidyl-prolyl cis-trans isomerase n=1 Tax=Turneriella parva (strain ATCC BAA-1111 / DSM 21527 / NCTC 11395 / H) TaxID=869212 RepID=I4B8P2_TURPD|nr:peptidylprolyl isomerase [Turneriella parva]AFM13649.1 peptidyl-prolyl cis-trans isomerase cyclophilin type [Turneriella parva DSM 21527]
MASRAFFTRLALLAALLPLTEACSKTPKNKAEAMKEVKEKMRKDTNPVAVIETTLGTITVELYRHAAPKTVENFVSLAKGEREFTDTDGKPAKRPYYDGLVFHRVIPNFMIQGGDIKGNGTGGPGYQFADEINAKALGLDKMKVSASPMAMQEVGQVARTEVFKKLNIQSQQDLTAKQKEAEALFKSEQAKWGEKSLEELYTARGITYTPGLESESNTKGSLSMANAGPNTNGSQFFISVADNIYLDGKHTVFGRVIGGLDIAEAITKVERDQQDRPKKTVVMKKVTILEN